MAKVRDKDHHSLLDLIWVFSQALGHDKTSFSHRQCRAQLAAHGFLLNPEEISLGGRAFMDKTRPTLRCPDSDRSSIFRVF
jgi:hypothetical protein